MAKAAAKLEDTHSTTIGRLMESFIYEFCPCMLQIMYASRTAGADSDHCNIIEQYMAFTRGYATSLGDHWWYNVVRFEKPVHVRISIIMDNFARWRARAGESETDRLNRIRYEDKTRKSVARLSKTFRHNRFILKDIDLTILQADIKYVESLRSLGVPLLKEAASKLLLDVFKVRPRE